MLVIIIHDDVVEVADQCASTIRQGGDIHLTTLMETVATPAVRGGDFNFVHAMILTLKTDIIQGLSHYMRRFLKRFFFFKLLVSNNPGGQVR